MPFTETTKLQVKRKAHFCCCICHDQGIEVHHIIPESEKGSNNEDNAAPLCPSCHDKYGANPQKRKSIKESRDFWYEICESRFGLQENLMQDIKSKIESTASKGDLNKAVENLKQFIAQQKGQGKITVELGQKDWDLITDGLEKLEMSSDEWQQILPSHQRNLPSILSAKMLVNTDFIKVITAVFLKEEWPGLTKEDLKINEMLVARVGRWGIYEDGIICLKAGHNNYPIQRNQVQNRDWFAHLLEKNWLYDPTDMIDAFEKAFQIYYPLETEEQCEEFIEAKIELALQRHKVPFYPSRILERRVYLASKMRKDERQAFCEFLAAHGYFASY